MLPIWFSLVSSKNLLNIEILQYLYYLDIFVFRIKFIKYNLGKTAEMKGKTGATNGCCGYGADGNQAKLFYMY